MPKRDVLVYLAVAFSGSVLASFLRWPYLTMFVPALAVLVARVPLRLDWDIPPRRLPLALLTLPIAIHAVAIPTIVALEGRLTWKFPWDASPAGLAALLAANAAFGLLVVAVLAFFEEVGWRAFFLTRVAAAQSPRRAVVLTAMVWALWHIPFALSGILQAGSVSRAQMALILPAGEFGAGLFLGWLWLDTRSILLVALAHGSLNNWGQFALKFLSTEPRHDLALLLAVNLAILATGLGALTRVR